ncbi:hypothetical protein C5C18_08595 [Rathayibacter tritici]|uniref:Lantibiotic n=1 Tax=Rathayibacter tritici TaxID=33888 RepID=A0A169C4Y2_9MICO|nr:hypothetical protein [Rathayibacter tritici]AND17581.1 hypothetical protein A6122_2465 [Rathayibacter tritici]PPF27805.1 hypothetical protein C5C06_08920 [Rathayibacter tritici]PPF66487.1 hypothetical protein C5C21_08990 [Rathayibacter tritici]PPG07038.1 hypothetical protein C5C18_08595 [Rathayibacter tritici]PPI19774.1 hypothetical protein C5D07_01075 [Rathayibacter tritici]
MPEILEREATVVSPHWDLTARAGHGTSPSVQAQIDEAFERVVSPYMGSSGWMCTLTIECGTVVCACR